jgi:hypothetical protein
MSGLGKARADSPQSLADKNNYRAVDVNFHHDFVASLHSYFFQGQMDRVLLYWPNHSGVTKLSRQKEGEDLSEKFYSIGPWFLESP